MNLGNMGSFTIVSVACFVLIISCNTSAIFADDLETYIVHVELPDAQLSTESLNTEDLENWYRSFLPPTTTTAGSSNDEGYSSQLLYSYHNVFKGFSAKLSPEQAKEMEKIPGFISARPQERLYLHTTHSPNFLGLIQNVNGFWNESSYGKGVIIGVLDTGINPNHPSFNDDGMPPVPSKWKGKCEFNITVCNRKLIGARVFQSGNLGSPMDQQGHGTHTASIAAGNFVKGANVYGNANGTAAGIAPRAHLAIYKVCTPVCSESAILAAMDVAIDDGVDILSISLGGRSKPYYSDNIALGAYSAMDRGIFVSCAAGNDGPFNSSLGNEAPWILTVGASTIDRKIIATVKLGNNEEFDGESAYQPIDFPPTTQFPLYYPGSNSSSRYCSSRITNNTMARGKIVVCDNGGNVSRIGKGQNVKNAGGVGMILINQQQHGYTTAANAHVLPVTHLSYIDGLKVLAYINSTKLPIIPTGSISFKGTFIGDNNAPTVAAFSSRGPSLSSPGILKPDIIGPGVNILAAWHRSVENISDSTSNFNLQSGTSMSCPHLSGVVALLKSVHPDWSPAAIKSAIMTTADVLNLAKNPIIDETFQPANVFAVGSGHVNLAKANDPGLIYDIKPEEYIPYLCGLNYTNLQIEEIVQRKVNCSTRIAQTQLNYPSFSITFGARVQTYTRIVTNVGRANSSYTVVVVPPINVNVTVKPETLRFSQLNQKLEYEVTFTRVGNRSDINSGSQGFLSWNSEKHSVRSPIVAIMGE